MLGFYWGRAAVRMRAGAGAAACNRGEAPSLQQDWRGRVWGGGAAGCCCGSTEIRLGVCVSGLAGSTLGRTWRGGLRSLGMFGCCSHGVGRVNQPVLYAWQQ